MPLPPTVAPVVDSVGKDDRRGGTLNLVSRQALEHQDVHREVSAALAAWGPGIAYSRLMRFQSGSDVELPSLAVECEVCDVWTMTDATSFEFRLREDVVWPDIHPLNGRRLVAGDILYSYERQRSEGAPNEALLHVVDTIEASADDLLRIELLAPDADFLSMLADGHSKIVAREVVELNGDLVLVLQSGSGAWILEDGGLAETYMFARNETYFEEGAPLLDRLHIHTIPDEGTAYAAFRVNSVDVHRLGPDEWREFSQQKPDASMLEFKEIGRGLEVGFKTTETPFDDLRVRQAAMLAIRPRAAIEEVWQGAAYLTQGAPLGSADWELENIGSHFDDRERATALLAEAIGMLPVPIEIKVGDFGEDYLIHAERMVSEMQSAGFDPQLEIVDRRQFGERVWLAGSMRCSWGLWLRCPRRMDTCSPC